MKCFDFSCWDNTSFLNWANFGQPIDKLDALCTLLTNHIHTCPHFIHSIISVTTWRHHVILNRIFRLIIGILGSTPGSILTEWSCYSFLSQFPLSIFKVLSWEYRLTLNMYLNNKYLQNGSLLFNPLLSDVLRIPVKCSESQNGAINNRTSITFTTNQKNIISKGLTINILISASLLAWQEKRRKNCLCGMFRVPINLGYAAPAGVWITYLTMPPPTAASC